MVIILIFIILGKQNIYFHNHSQYMRRKTDKINFSIEIKLKHITFYTKLSRLDVGISVE